MLNSRLLLGIFMAMKYIKSIFIHLKSNIKKKLTKPAVPRIIGKLQIKRSN